MISAERAGRVAVGLARWLVVLALTAFLWVAVVFSEQVLVGLGLMSVGCLTVVSIALEFVSGSLLPESVRERLADARGGGRA